MPMDYEETEFVWEDYLQETGATPVPPTAFKHASITCTIYVFVCVCELFGLALIEQMCENIF